MSQVQLPARFANRQQKRNLVQAVSAGLGMASPPYVSIKGNQFTLVDANGEQEPVETKHLDCVIFDVNVDVPVQRVYWGNVKYNPNSDTYQAPACFSDNGVGASAQATSPQSQSCQTCPQNTWGSATSLVTGKPTKACHVIKKIAVIPVEGTVGQDGTYVPKSIQGFPFLLRVPVMSHENLRAYSSKFGGQDFDVSDVVTRITFVHGQVGQLDFQAAGFTDEATEAAVQKFLAEHLTDGLVGRGDRPWTGALPAPAQQQPTPVAAQPAQAAAIPHTGATNAAPFATMAVSAAEEPAKRTRRTKAQIEADNAAQAAQPPHAAQDQSGIPPFLRRDPASPEASQGRAATPFQNGQAPSHGIQANAPPPNAELEASLANVFGLKT